MAGIPSRSRPSRAVQSGIRPRSECKAERRGSNGGSCAGRRRACPAACHRGRQGPAYHQERRAVSRENRQKIRRIQANPPTIAGKPGQPEVAAKQQRCFAIRHHARVELIGRCHPIHAAAVADCNAAAAQAGRQRRLQLPTPAGECAVPGAGHLDRIALRPRDQIRGAHVQGSPGRQCRLERNLHLPGQHAPCGQAEQRAAGECVGSGHSASVAYSCRFGACAPQALKPRCHKTAIQKELRVKFMALRGRGTWRFPRRCSDRPVGVSMVQGQRTSGGRLIRIASTLPPVLRPKVVPRSYRRLNST